jgi:glucose/arabinose dehydrogenase
VLYVGDVGSETWEEIDVVEAGRNYGWPAMEGVGCGPDVPSCDSDAEPNAENADGYTMPIATIMSTPEMHAAIIGGFVYRSCEVPAWEGTYMYSDWLDRGLLGLRWDGSMVDDLGKLTDAKAPTTLGTNAWGDVYVGTGFNSGPRVISRVAPAP